ncbi:MAG: hypothetical protein ACYCQK_04630 [Acidiferrobacteraceae bacterium]
MNLSAHSGALLVTLASAGALGVLHGVLPDEHTWPITFSYAIGRQGARGGALAGLLFSLAFTLQRALAAELAYFALLPVTRLIGWQFYLYIVVGLVMLVSGRYALRGRMLHLFTPRPYPSADPKALPAYMPLVHGFIAGWGTGAFALAVYTVLVPRMSGAATAFLPGLAFGIGTMIAQIVLGSLIGSWMARRRLGARARDYVAKHVAGLTLAWGGFAFIVVGAVGVWQPALVNWHIATDLPVFSLRELDVGFFLAVIVLLVIAGLALVRSLHEATRRYGSERS